MLYFYYSHFCSVFAETDLILWKIIEDVTSYSISAPRLGLNSAFVCVSFHTCWKTAQYGVAPQPRISSSLPITFTTFLPVFLSSTRSAQIDLAFHNNSALNFSQAVISVVMMLRYRHRRQSSCEWRHASKFDLGVFDVTRHQTIKKLAESSSISDLWECVNCMRGMRSNFPCIFLVVPEYFLYFCE